MKKSSMDVSIMSFNVRYANANDDMNGLPIPRIYVVHHGTCKKVADGTNARILSHKSFESTILSLLGYRSQIFFSPPSTLLPPFFVYHPKEAMEGQINDVVDILPQYSRFGLSRLGTNQDEYSGPLLTAQTMGFMSLQNEQRSCTTALSSNSLLVATFPYR